jgi:hypothetical protein
MTDRTEVAARARAATLANRTHGIRLRRLRLQSAERGYDVDFRGPDGAARSLSIIAGAFSTGKTTVLEFIDYCLGAAEHPRHPEVMPRVRSAALEVDLSGVTHVIERPVGQPSTWASVQRGSLDERAESPPERRPLRPAGHADSLSSLLLAHCKLEGIQLRDLPEDAESQTDPLSFRELMWLCLLPNERLDGDLLFERTPMKHLRLRQVVDVVFDVHDDRAVKLGRQIKQLEIQLAAGRAAFAGARQLMDEERLGDAALLTEARERAAAELAEAERALGVLDERLRASTDFVQHLRERHHAATEEAGRAAEALRDAETQLHRMAPLRAQYADDVAKLTMLAEAHTLFDPLRVSVCPACQASLTWPLVVDDGHCGLCRTALPAGAPPVDVGSELRAAKARLAELTRWIEELESSLPRLRDAADRAVTAESAVAAELDAATVAVVTPFLAERDAHARRYQHALADRERSALGLQMIASLERRSADLTRQEQAIAALREELNDTGGMLAERTATIDRVSARFRAILADWHFPKLTDAQLSDDLTPYVRGQRYTDASSGGRTLISLAWQLALFEIAWEANSAHPGFLVIDSPQKNLSEFADAAADIYRHLRSWLAGPGAGAQIVVADNAAPSEVEADVVIRFTRRPDQPPYGLIDDETG